VAACDGGGEGDPRGCSRLASACLVFRFSGDSVAAGGRTECGCIYNWAVVGPQMEACGLHETGSQKWAVDSDYLIR
jgi:hypothetical protein